MRHKTEEESAMELESLFTPKPAEHYKDLTNGGEFNLKLSQQEACVILKSHDYGVDSLAPDEKDDLHRIIGRLKSEIWP